MKTLVRVIDQSKLSQFNSETYKKFCIQLLRYAYANSEHVEIFGTIYFQSGGLTAIEGIDRNLNDWYGMTVECHSDNERDFIDCARILKHIRSNRDNYNAQPNEILALIGAVEFEIFDGLWIPKSCNGQKVFQVLNEDSTCYARIFAPSESLAIAKMKKRKYDNKTLKFDRIVTF